MLDPLGPEPYPGKDAFREALTLGDLQDGVDYGSSHKPEVSGTVCDLHIAHPVDKAVEGTREIAPYLGLALAGNTSCRHDVAFIGIKGPDHVGDQGRRVLHIGIHYRDVIALSLLQTGIHRGFLAEIPGKHYISYAGVGRSILPDQLSRLIRASVINEDEFEGLIPAVFGISYFAQGIVKMGKGFFLVITRNYKAYEHLWGSSRFRRQLKQLNKMYYNQKVVLLIYERRTVSDERIVCA